MGEVELIEKLGRDDLCPCGSRRLFQALLHEEQQIRRLRTVVLLPGRLSPSRQTFAQAPPPPGGASGAGISLFPLIMFAAGPGTITVVVTMAAVHTPSALPLTALIASVTGAGITFGAFLLASLSCRLTKLIYLAIRGHEKTSRTVRGWLTAVNQFAIMFEDRFKPIQG